VIISQTPYRVSFAGGGTDLPAFCEQEPGAVLSTTIAQHMYVTVSRRFKSNTRVAYTRTEIVETIDEIEHGIVREALRMTGLGPHIEVTTKGDLPAGTGLGSSSSLAVGLINALNAYKGNVSKRSDLADSACRIEIDILGKPIGRQDQTAAAFGGLNYIRFETDGRVTVEPIACREDTIRHLEERSLLVYTNLQRDANQILEKQSAATNGRMSALRQMRDLADEATAALTGAGDIDEFARLIHTGWELKRSLGCGISTPLIDEWYDAARRAGAEGGKLLGAGGGGFVYLIAPPENHAAIRDALGNPAEIDFKIDRAGSRIIFIY